MAKKRLKGFASIAKTAKPASSPNGLGSVKKRRFTIFILTGNDFPRLTALMVTVAKVFGNDESVAGAPYP